MDLGAVLDGLGVRLATISGLNVLDYLPDDIPVPAAVVDWPSTVEYDSTMARGSNRIETEVHAFISLVDAESARDALVSYMSLSHANSVKAAIEDDPSLGGVAMTVRVMEAKAEVWSFASVDYLAATFTVEVYA
jgi:hypothetical protein